MARPKLSLVLCSRNDSYQGNALWRLSTALNWAAARVEELGRESDVEILVSDWGSSARLEASVHLSPTAAGLTSFVWTPPDLARELQRDSPFAEVLALNAAVRRARGEYIGRIDQDTLVGEGFLRWFFESFLEGSSSVPPDGILLSNRRSIPYRFAVQCPSVEAVGRFIANAGRTLPLSSTQPEHLYYRNAIGIVMMRRDLWHACTGYDESMIYFNHMEVDLVLRLMQRFPFLNLGRVVDHDFYHLDHEHPLAQWGASGRRRKMNPLRDAVDNPPLAFAPNGADWGLNSFAPVTVRRAAPSGEWKIGGGSGRGTSAWGYRLVRVRSILMRWGDQTAVWSLNLLMAAPRFVVRRSPSLRAKADAARNSVREHPLRRWPGLLLDHFRGRPDPTDRTAPVRARNGIPR
jgi:hypothetical protein